MLGRLRRNRDDDELIDVAERLAPYVEECLDGRIVFPDVGQPTIDPAAILAQHPVLVGGLGVDPLAADAVG